MPISLTWLIMEMSYHVAFADTFHMVESARWRERMKRIISSVPTCAQGTHFNYPRFFRCLYIFYSNHWKRYTIANGSEFSLVPFCLHISLHMCILYRLLENLFQRYNRYDINAPSINTHTVCVHVLVSTSNGAHVIFNWKSFHIIIIDVTSKYTKYGISTTDTRVSCIVYINIFQQNRFWIHSRPYSCVLFNFIFSIAPGEFSAIEHWIRWVYGTCWSFWKCFWVKIEKFNINQCQRANVMGFFCVALSMRLRW